MRTGRILVIGAGMGGLVAALLLASRGFAVTVIESAATPGGKMREVAPGGAKIDAGPTVLTMRWVFDEILDEVGVSLADRLTLRPLETLARHAWRDGARLDLFRHTSAAPTRSASSPARGGGGLSSVLRTRRSDVRNAARHFHSRVRPTR